MNSIDNKKSNTVPDEDEVWDLNMERLVVRKIHKMEEDNKKKLGGNRESLTSLSDVSDTR